jgi:hypothetical protein
MASPDQERLRDSRALEGQRVKVRLTIEADLSFAKGENPTDTDIIDEARAVGETVDWEIK